MKRYAIALALACACMAQEGPAVNQTAGPPPSAWTTLLFYDGSNNLIYSCKAQSLQRTFDYVRAAQLTNIVVAANTGTATTSANHGLQVGNRVTVAGSSTTALNGTYIIQSVPSATTFTITTSGVGNGTYTDPTGLSTTAPRSSAAQWSINHYTYSGSNLSSIQWSGGTVGPTAICDNRASIAYE